MAMMAFGAPSLLRKRRYCAPRYVWLRSKVDLPRFCVYQTIPLIRARNTQSHHRAPRRDCTSFPDVEIVGARTVYCPSSARGLLRNANTARRDDDVCLSSRFPFGLSEAEPSYSKSFEFTATSIAHGALARALPPE